MVPTFTWLRNEKKTETFCSEGFWNFFCCKDKNYLTSLWLLRPLKSFLPPSWSLAKVSWMDKLISESFLSFFAHSNFFFYFENISFTFDKRSFRMRTHFVLQILKNTLGASFTMDHKSVIFLKSTNSLRFMVVFTQLFYKLIKRLMKRGLRIKPLPAGLYEAVALKDYSFSKSKRPYFKL